MANLYRLTLQQRHRLPPVSTGVSSGYSTCLSCVSGVSKKSDCRRFKASRRLVVGLGAAFCSQFMTMAGTLGANSLIASARQRGAVEQVLKDVQWPEQFPFKEEYFQRFDESPDSLFYETPRFVTHIDDPAIAALTKYYSEVFPPSNTPGVSHFPPGYKQDRIVGMGMNEEELKCNPVLTEYVVQDLNLNPKLPFEDNSFDVITNVSVPEKNGKWLHLFYVQNSQVSVDYLTKPIEVFKEMCQVLKPGGLAIVSFSNRCFWTKAISIWTSTGDADHVMIVGAYFHYAGGYEPPQAVDISPNPGRSDPMYVVYSRKASTA
ncbi:uncharacterized protein LOC18055536 isoform X2 [Citrus clementina]|uniref:uncharacterized protein LOC18055536 isoform X2 n=1 Tax=Citrus clementina TaxID=85681 RepID=UPI000CECFC8E|nr:uncharacterized protein LOC18055536 isoform X2 [Citrus x clementina]